LMMDQSNCSFLGRKKIFVGVHPSLIYRSMKILKKGFITLYKLGGPLNTPNKLHGCQMWYHTQYIFKGYSMCSCTWMANFKPWFLPHSKSKWTYSFHHIHSYGLNF
jgi:hypothetical protein